MNNEQVINFLLEKIKSNKNEIDKLQLESDNDSNVDNSTIVDFLEQSNKQFKKTINILEDESTINQ